MFKRAREKEITFNKDKCEFNKDKCLYYGMVFSKEGASPDPMKVEAIKQAEPPRNAKELNSFLSFLCTVQYNARFMESYAPQTDVLRALVRADVFKWEEKHQEAFEALLKNALSADTVLAYFQAVINETDIEAASASGPLQFSKLPIINGPLKLLVFTCKIEISIVLHLT